MTGRDATDRGRFLGTWRARLAVVAGLVLVGGVCLALRNHAGPATADAQAPQRTAQPATPARAPQPQAARTASAQGVATNSGQNGNSGQNRKASAKANRPSIGSLKVMAVVNGKQISREELSQECLRRFGSEVLESIVNKHLIWQECQKRSLVITEQDVDDEVEQMAAKFGLSVANLMKLLQDERDITAEQYRREIVWPTIALRRLAAEEIQVTQDELRKAFETEYGPRVKVRMIAARTKAKAEGLLESVKADPASFGEVAKNHSIDPNSASVRGLIPPIRRHLGNDELERIAFGLEEGEISPIIPIANQFLILQCEKRIPETYIPSQHLESTQKRLHDSIRDNKLRSRANTIFQELEEAAKVTYVHNDPQLVQQNPGVAARINGRQISTEQLAEECLVRHGAEVLEGEINRRLLSQELARKNLNVTQQDIRREIARAADAYGYLKEDGSPDIDEWLEYVTEKEGLETELYVHDVVWPTAALKQIVGPEIEVSEEEMQKGFVANYGERVEVLAIVLGNLRQAQEVWDRARNDPTDQAFGELAHQYSIEPVSKANYGKVPPIRRHGGQEHVEKEAFKLKPGELSGIIAIEDRYIILRCLGHTEPFVEDISEVQEELHKDLHERKMRLEMATTFDRLKENAQIDNFVAGTSQSGKLSRRPTGPAR